MSVSPLAFNVRIVDDRGYPTPVFLRLLQDQRTANAYIPADATAASNVLDLLGSSAYSLLMRSTSSWSTITPPADAKKFLNGANPLAWAQVKGSDLSMSDVTTNNVTSSAHGFAPKSPADATKFLNGAASPTYAQVKDSDLSTSDVTTNDVSATKHGFAPKAPNDATKYLDGTGAWSTPAGGGGGGGSNIDYAKPNFLNPTSGGSGSANYFVGNLFAVPDNISVGSIKFLSTVAYGPVTMTPVIYLYDMTTGAATTRIAYGATVSGSIVGIQKLSFGSAVALTANTTVLFGILSTGAAPTAAQTNTSNYRGYFNYSSTPPPDPAPSLTWNAVRWATWWLSSEV